MSLISIGSDMECFAKTTEGEHIALCGRIGGSKMEPKPLKHLGEGYMIQEDNVALEFNIPVCARKGDFVRSMQIMRNEVREILGNMNLLLSTEASFSFSKGQLTHPNALVFGCEPDYNAWSMEENSKPKADDECLRTAGGHVHVGTDIDMVVGVRQMDLMLGVPSILVDDKPSSIARRKLYGKSGAMRPKPYGFEYRVLSNFWMFSDALVKWVYSGTLNAVDHNFDLSEEDGKLIEQCINTSDKDIAKKLVKKWGIEVPA